MSHVSEGNVFVKVIADSTWCCDRITTVHASYPRYIHAQVKTHRLMSTNSRSSRAVPVKRLLREVQDNPGYPLSWRLVGKGMSPSGPMRGWRALACKGLWWVLSRAVIIGVKGFACLGLAKELANRWLEPMTTIHTLITFTSRAPTLRGQATEYVDVLQSFLGLRDHSEAQSEIAALARCLRKAVDRSTPKLSRIHTPYVDSDLTEAMDLSAARSARVSYAPFDEAKPNPQKDLKLAKRLLKAKHLSPFEHPSVWLGGDWANKSGWCAWRHLPSDYKIKKQEKE